MLCAAAATGAPVFRARGPQCGILLTRQELERRGSRFRARDGVGVAGGVAALLRAVLGVDLVVDVVGLDEEDVFVDAAGPDVAFVMHLYAAEPG